MNTTRTQRIAWAACLLLLATPVTTLAQSSQGFPSWPEPVVLETWSGTILVDESGARTVYYLDVDDDGVADYHLSFGPWWYEPASGAVRPEAGDVVTLLAASWDCDRPDTLMVFEIDGLVWREAVEYTADGFTELSTWEGGACQLTVTGTVLVDDTYYYLHYFLDTDADGLADYKLGFGPPWYEPASGAVKPDDGDVVTITGCVHEVDGPDILAVFEIDGLTWRELGQPAPWAGGWVSTSGTSPGWAWAGNDPGSGIEFPGGNRVIAGADHGNGPGGNGGPVEFFVEFWSIHPDFVPGIRNQETNRFRFAGFHVDLFDPEGHSLMNRQYGQDVGPLRFQNENRFRLRWNEQERARLGVPFDDLGVEYWDPETESWSSVPQASVDEAEQVLTFESVDLYPYYSISAAWTVAASEDRSAMPRSFELYQNYPNPFNPVTHIPFEVSTPQRVQLKVFNLLGVEVATLVDGMVPAGRHTARFDAADRPSGVYLYSIRCNEWKQVRIMVLVK